MKTNGNDPAFSGEENKECHIPGFLTQPTRHTGLTKREYFAAMAMQGIQASMGEGSIGAAECSKMAVEQGDALIYELNRKQNEF